ncbi:nuclear transport factor 2 family protein [Nocardioides glacieisoli]|uniref:Nuclear transport factor 2 family protein n=1 Tax=Nocardioides glacieisoli TaxID=1168730 RepID=A0A4Q2RJ35_9ACTN|nr:nuclear transport factor 2 family protein [Nocardioides glacieisoli]RYB88710.1 nuclear transport factor 2 family protein [Nocardioides glacieisoli]
MNDTTAFAWDELPQVVADYLRAHVVQDFATAMTYLPEDVTVIDNGEVLQGRGATFKVFDQSAKDYDVDTTLGSVSRPADDVWEVETHLSGNFPGGEVDLRMIFTLVDDVIQKLEITV